MPLVTGQTREERKAGRVAGTQTSLLGALLGRGARNQAPAPAQAPAGGGLFGGAWDPPSGGPLAGEQQAVTDLAAAGEADIAGQREVIEQNRLAAEAERASMELEQAGTMRTITWADDAAKQGLTDVQGQIEATREEIARMPEKVQTEFDRQQTRIDTGLEQARTGLAEQRTEALGNVMQNQGMVMEAAVQGIHGGIRQQISAIDAQVQQGIISPSQATMMKSQIRMGGAMQLSAAVGQTAHLFTQTQAQVATSFGSMFTQFEGTAAQVQGQFGATAGSVFGQVQVAASKFNTELTALDAQATAHRDTMLSQNAATRATFQNMNDVNNMAMLDYTQDTYVLETPVAINNLQAEHMLAGDFFKSEHGQQMLEIMRENQQLTQQGSFWQMLMGLIPMGIEILG